MQKPMRRADRAVPEQETAELLEKAEYGYLATVDEDGEPYVLPLNFAYDNRSIYFHCAYEGQKIENILRDNRVCFSVAGGTRVISERFTTKYQSAVVRGHAKMIEDEPKRNALRLLCQKYSPQFMPQAEAYMVRSAGKTCVIQITIDSITGKANK